MSIQSSLDARLQTVVGLPTLQLENTRYTPSTAVPFSRSTFLPAETRPISAGINGMNAQHGLYQIDLFYPIDRGTGASIAMVDTVLAAFRRGTTVGTTPVVNIEMSWREAGYSHQQFYCVPITVRWTAYVQN